MKTVSMILASVILFTAQMGQAKWVQASEAQAKDLKAALALTSFDCAPAVNMRSVTDALAGVQAVYLDDAGAQPVLKFIRTYDDKLRVVFTLTTSSDFTKINLLVLESQKAQFVNRGTLIKPLIKKEFVTTEKYQCK